MKSRETGDDNGGDGGNIGCGGGEDAIITDTFTGAGGDTASDHLWYHKQALDDNRLVDTVGYTSLSLLSCHHQLAPPFHIHHYSYFAFSVCLTCHYSSSDDVVP